MFVRVHKQLGNQHSATHGIGDYRCTLEINIARTGTDLDQTDDVYACVGGEISVLTSGQAAELDAWTIPCGRVNAHLASANSIQVDSEPARIPARQQAP